MRTLSFLRLPAPAQEDLRRKTVQAVLDGGKVKAIAKLFGITRQSLHRWMSAYHADGEKALLAKKRPKRQGKLLPWQCAQVVRAISDKCPEQLKLPGFWLWTRDAVCQYIESSFGIILSVSTGGRYLRRWGLTPQKPAKRAYQSDSAACKRWMEEEYPAMRHQANREKATILWGDECGFRSDHQTGTSYSKRGKTPVIPATGDRFRCNMVSAIVNDTAARIKSNGSVDIFSGRNIDNSGEIIAGKNSELSGRSVTNSGTVQSRKNMTVWAESGDVTNAGAFFAGGNAKFSIAGAMTNQGGTVSAGDKLVMAVAAGVSNTGDIVADKSLITAGGLFHNTGSVDGDEVVIKVSSLQNYSTGTIQGDYLAVQAGSIINGLSGTGTGTSGRLGARGRLDLGADSITNREDGLLYSDGDIFVGSSLDGNNQATGSASSLLNSSAVIDVAGSIHAAVGHFQNINDHYATELREVKRGTYQGYRLPGASLEEIWIPENDPSTHWDGGEWAQIHGQWVEDFFIHNGTVVEYDTFVTSSRPGFVYTGGDLTVTGRITNDKSRIISSRTVSATGGFNNIAAIEPYIVKESGNFHYTFVTATGWTGRHKRVFDWQQSYALPDVIAYNEKDVVLDGQ